MKRLLISFFVVLLFLTSGCAKRLSGRYEALMGAPRMDLSTLDAKSRAQMEGVAKQMDAMSRVTLEFDGSKVRMGTASVITEYGYKADGNDLELSTEAMGQKAFLPMTIEPDGSITYLTLRFRKVH